MHTSTLVCVNQAAVTSPGQRYAVGQDGGYGLGPAQCPDLGGRTKSRTALVCFPSPMTPFLFSSSGKTFVFLLFFFYTVSHSPWKPVSLAASVLRIGKQSGV